MKRLGFFTLALTFAIQPATLLAQKKEDFIALQRDVAALQEQIKTLQKSQDDKFAALQGAIQQAVDANSRITSAMTALQREIDSKLADQSSKLVAPVATLGSKIDQVSDDTRAMGNSVSDLVQRVNALDTKLKDISDAVRTLAAQTPATPPPGPQTAATPPPPACPTPASELWENARRDYSAGHTSIAQTEYSDYLKCYRDTANAPAAQFKIGMIYFDGGHYDDAVQAFGDAVEGFPENPSRPEAMYYKAVALMKEGQHKTEAGDAFKEYLSTYAHGTHVQDAHRNLRVLGLEPGNRKR